MAGLIYIKTKEPTEAFEGISEITTNAIVRLRSTASLIWDPEWVVWSGTNKNVSNASYAGYIFSNLPPGRKFGLIDSVVEKRK